MKRFGERLRPLARALTVPGIAVSLLAVAAISARAPYHQSSVV